MLLWLVFNKIPFREVSSLWKQVNVFYLVGASLLFLASQVLSTKRLELYLKAQNFHLSFRSNLKLYFLGMFYNFFIPGGIGGDAYKVYLLNKKFSWGAKKITSSLFNDRLSGLIAIFLVAIFGGIFILPDYRWLLGLAFIFILGASYIGISKIFSTYRKVHFQGLLYSCGIQLLQVLSFMMILKSLNVDSGYILYSLMFLASSVLSLISFAGIGVREMLFFQASKLYHFDPAVSISASLLFTIITAFFSLIGVFFQLKNLNLTTTQN